MRPTEVFAHSHKPIRSLADMKGFKMRTVGAWADILPKLGASVITLPGGEVFAGPGEEGHRRDGMGLRGGKPAHGIP